MKKLLLVGGGHSHIQVLKRLKEESLKEVDITLISPSKYQYFPELFPGYSEGTYKEEDIRVDLEELARVAGVNWKEGAILSIDPVQKQALTAEGDILDFNIISLNIGSMTSRTNNISLSKNIFTIKPNYQFTNAVNAVRRADNPVIIGENAAAVEIASSLQAWRTKQKNSPITLIAQNRLLPEMDEKISKTIAKRLREDGIILYEGDTIKKIEEDIININSSIIPFGKLLLLLNSKAPDLLKLSKLPVNEEGYLTIEKTLQVKKYPFIFGAGECAVIEGYRSSSHSLYTSRRQGDVLYANLKGFIDTGEGEFYEDTRKTPFLLELGNKQGFAVFKNRSSLGKIPWVLRRIQNKKLL
ncbi:FAD-dependent oxidoreductase [Bacillus sp. P14.5]|uniref:NAD(P)/FAD-dependent oxidoreductase n=1 Tax=Bacillus sp. P14.5 TaxID=1983400 RepID=UPI000DE95497|nr:FAD-dependent oxidoreductase [Bacillus sp. P14.5]